MSVFDLFDLTGKVALVTGAAQGLGQAMAVGLAEAGAEVVLLDRSDCSLSMELITSAPGNCRSMEEDLLHLTSQSAKDIVEQIVDSCGSLDILVNNAGIIRRAPASEFSEKDWKEVLQVNLDAAFFLSQAVGAHFLEQSKTGKIINMASMLSFQGGLTVASYTAAKSAVAGITKALSNEWAQFGINVNAIAPGYFKTSVTKGIYSDPARNQAILNRIPCGKWGQPNDLKGVVTFLASGASNYLHGSIIPVDGGWLAR